MRVLRTLAILLCVIVAAAALVLAYGIPAGFLIEPIQTRFEAETGNRLHITDARLSLWPSPAMSVGQISVRDKNEPNARSRVTAESARLAISFKSLLEGKPRLTEVEVIRPVLRVPITRERAARATRSVRTTERHAKSEPALMFDRLIVRDGTVEMLSSGERLESGIIGIELEAAVNAADETLDIKASGRWDDQTIRVSVNGKILQGRLDAPSTPVEFVIELPGLQEEKLSGSAEIKISGAQLGINALTGAIGRNRFNGWASVDFADKPLVKVDLDFPRVDIEGRPPVADAVRPAAPSDLDQPWSDRHVNLDGLNFFDADVQFSATELLLDKFRFAPIAAKATLNSGVLKTTVSRAGIYSGEAKGALTIDASSRAPGHAMQVELNGVRAAPLLSDVIGLSALDGSLRARMELRASGSSQRAIMSSLGGMIDLLLSDGEIRDINVAQMIRALTSGSLSGWQQSKTEKTDLSQLSAVFRIDSGRATTDNLRLAGPLVRVSGAGTADLAAKTLNFKLDPKLVVSLEGQGSTGDPLGFGVPVVMQGTWGQPRIYLDMAGILENPDAAYAKLRELGGGLFGKGGSNDLMQSIGSFLERLGRDAPKPGEATKSQPSTPQAQSPAQPQVQASPPNGPPAPTPREQGQQKPQDVEGQIRDILRDLFRR